MNKIKCWWRNLRNRCILCNKKKESHKYCMHCIYPRYCHNCGKHWNFGTMYSMSKESVMRELQGYEE